MFAGAQAGLRGEEVRLNLFGRDRFDAVMKARDEIAPSVVLFDDAALLGITPSVFQLAPMTDGFIPQRGPRSLPPLTPFADLPQILPGLERADMREPALDAEQRVLPPESERSMSLPGDAWSEAVVEGPGLDHAAMLWAAADTSLGGLEVPGDVPNIPAFYELMHATMQNILSGQGIAEPDADRKASFALRLQAAKYQVYTFAQAVARAHEGTVNASAPNAWLLQNLADKLSDLGVAVDNFMSQDAAEIPLSLHRALARLGLFFFHGELRAIDGIEKAEVESLSLAEKSAWALRLMDYAQRAVNRAAGEVLALRDQKKLSAADLAHVQRVVQQALARVMKLMPAGANETERAFFTVLRGAAHLYLSQLNTHLIAVQRQFVREPQRVDALSAFIGDLASVRVAGDFSLQFPSVAVSLDTRLVAWLDTKSQVPRRAVASEVVWFIKEKAKGDELAPQTTPVSVLVRMAAVSDDMFANMAWPPNPDDIRLSTILKALGWTMSVQSVEGGFEIRVRNIDTGLPVLTRRTPAPPPVRPESADSRSDDNP